ncbi:MAG: patatin-like phospholipase family protein [Myxococcota bacterium]
MGPRRALVLSGGGARGAYEAGIIRYILEVLPEDLGFTPNFEVICGTSVGAINSAWLAATINDPQFSAQKLWYLWRTLRFSEVVRVSYSDVLQMARSFFKRLPAGGKPLLEDPDGRGGGVLNTSFFDQLIRNEIPFDNIARNIDRGLLDGLTVSATDIVTSRTTVFVQQSGDELPPWTRDPRRIAVAGPVNADKVLASAAIPMLFPPIRIGHHWFCDGGLRQNTPLSPALRLEADKVLVIALRSRGDWPVPGPFDARSDAPDDQVPSTFFLLGKILDALLLDPLDYDLTVLERINGILEQGEEAFGDESFTDALNDVVRAYRGQEYEIIEPLLLRPSQDLGRLASEFAGRQSTDFWGSRLVASICQSASERDGYRESDLLSYVLFDGGYTGQLLDLGYADAGEKHDELCEFFTD